MESPNLSGSSVSDISLTSEKANDKEDPLSSSRSTWKSRRDCIQGYFTYLMSFANALQFGASIGKYGFLIFIPYTICNIFVGIPAVLVELIMTRYVMGNAAKAWSMCPLTKGVLWNLVGITVVSISNNFIYSVYLIKYFFWSFTDGLKWSSCDEPWNKINCYEAGKKTKAFNECLKNNSDKFCFSLNWETSGTQFWKHEIADKTSVAVDVSFAFCLILSIFFIVLIIFKDIRSLEKMFILLVTSPILLGTILAWVAFSTPEALFGLKKLCTLNWDWLLHPQIWVEGLQNTIIFLGLGDLSLTLISSHGGFADDIFSDVLVVTFGGFLFSSLLTIPYLSVTVGSQGEQLLNEEVHFQEIEEVFVSISDALILYPFPNTLWSALTYLNWFLILMGAQAVLVLSVCEIFIGLLDSDFFCTVVSFLISSLLSTICFMFFNIEFKIDIGSVALMVIILFTITWQIFYRVQKFNNDVFFMLGYPLPFYIKCSWFTLLTVTVTILIVKLYYGIPSKPFKYMYYAYVCIPILIYVVGVIAEIATIKQDKRHIIELFLANPNWVPENPLLKKSRIILDTGNVNREFMYRQELHNKPFKKPPDFTEQNIVQLI